jgi:hypothetical protein
MSDTLPAGGRIKTEAEQKALESMNKARTHQINVLSEKIEQNLTRINTTEQILNKTVGETSRLRKNLYGLLGAKQDTTVAALFEKEDRMKLESIIRRYQSLQAEDLITEEQLRDVRAAYGKDGEIEIDDDALVSADDHLVGGYWVQAWVYWIPK